MHLAARSFVALAAIAVLAIAAEWSAAPWLLGLWRLPAALLLVGLALEAFWMQRTRLEATVEIAPRCFLGRVQLAALLLRHDAPRALTVEYAALLPAGFEPIGSPRRVVASAGGVARDPWALAPVRLGRQSWCALPARLRGRFGLAWWSRDLELAGSVSIAPDTLRTPRRARGLAAGERARRAPGSGAELLQLRRYQRGDPPARIDWKATARGGALVTRVVSDDQQLDILFALDAGRTSRTRAGPLDRLAWYANTVARFAEQAVRHDDRVGLCVFGEQVLRWLAPARGIAAVARVRAALESLEPEAGESDPVAAAYSIRGALRHRSLVVLLADCAQGAQSEEWPQALRILMPPHLALIAQILGTVAPRLAARPARATLDAWVSLAARQELAQAAARLERLRRLGAPVVAQPEPRLEAALIDRYEELRRRRRI